MSTIVAMFKTLDIPGFVLETPGCRVLESEMSARETPTPQETEAAGLRRQLANAENLIRGMASIPGTSPEAIGAYGFAAELLGGILRHEDAK